MIHVKGSSFHWRIKQTFHWRIKEGGNEGLRADLLLPRAAPMGLVNILRAAPILVDVGITHPSTKIVRSRPRRRGQGLRQKPWRKINSGTTTTTSWSQSGDCFQSLWRLGDGFLKTLGDGFLKTLAVPSALTFAMTSSEWEQGWTYGLITRYNVYRRDLIDAMVIALVKEVAGTLLWNTDHRGPATSEPLLMGSGIALVKLWTRSHRSHLGLKWFPALNFTPAREPPARHPLSSRQTGFSM